MCRARHGGGRAAEPAGAASSKRISMAINIGEVLAASASLPYRDEASRLAGGRGRNARKPQVAAKIISMASLLKRNKEMATLHLNIARRAQSAINRGMRPGEVMRRRPLAYPAVSRNHIAY